MTRALIIALLLLFIPSSMAGAVWIQNILPVQSIGDADDFHTRITLVPTTDEPNVATPAHQISMVARYLGTKAMPGHVSWGVSQFTGFAAPEDYQLGRQKCQSCSALQMYETGAGMFINTWSINRAEVDVSKGNPHINYEYSWKKSTIRPWSGADSDLVIQATLKLPWLHYEAAGPETAIPQLSYTFYARDATTNKVLHMLILIHDRRGDHPEGILLDEAGNAFVSTSLRPGLQYATPSPYSHLFDAGTWSEPRFYRVHITRANLLAAIAALDNGMSTDPADYVLTGVTVNLEVCGWVEGSNASVGASVRDFSVLECTGLDCSVP
jgi:hypothetical protein